MKTISFLKKHFILAFALMMGVVAMSFAMADENTTVTKRAPVTYYYNSTDTSDDAFAVPGHWSTTNGSMCETGGKRPCSIVVQDGQSLNSILAGKDNDQVLAIAQGRKP